MSAVRKVWGLLFAQVREVRIPERPTARHILPGVWNRNILRHTLRSVPTEKMNQKDGRWLDGVRLGWVSKPMHQRIVSYAKRHGHKKVNDAVVALIDLSLTEDEEGIDYTPPAITTSFEVEQD